MLALLGTSLPILIWSTGAPCYDSYTDTGALLTVPGCYTEARYVSILYHIFERVIGTLMLFLSPRVRPSQEAHLIKIINSFFSPMICQIMTPS